MQTGQTVRAIYIANGTHLMDGTVTSYRGTILELNVTAMGGSGTHGAWVFALPARTTIINNAANDWGRATPDTMGSRDTTGLNNFYVEDCYFAGAQCFDFDDNSRTVVRRCLFNMIVMSLRRNCRYAGHDYPVPRQVGQGHDGTGPILDPLDIWNNSGNPRVGLNDYEPDEVGRGLHSADYIREGREYHVGKAKPGYAKYAYPHPLRRELLPEHSSSSTEIIPFRSVSANLPWF